MTMSNGDEDFCSGHLGNACDYNAGQHLALLPAIQVNELNNAPIGPRSLANPSEYHRARKDKKSD
jgi:hypothetical protein